MYEIKKDLKVTGKVQFKRQVVVQILNEVLQSTEDLIVERAIAVDANGNAVELDSIICYVHQTKSDEIPDQYDPPKSTEIKPGFSRPNYGIGSLLKELFSEDKVYNFEDILEEARTQFPRLTVKQLRQYLKRPKMTGGRLIWDERNDQYWNPDQPPLKVAK